MIAKIQNDQPDNSMSIGDAAIGAVAGAAVGAGGAALHGHRVLSRNTPIDIAKASYEKLTKEGSDMFKFIAAGDKVFDKYDINADVLHTAAFDALKKQNVSEGVLDALQAIVRDGPNAANMLNPEISAELKKIDQNAFRKDMIEGVAKVVAAQEGKPEAEMIKELQTSIGELEKAGKGLFTEVENAGRTALGTIKYKAASALEKPFVAFESMSTRGKVGLGAVMTVAALAAAMGSNRLFADRVDQSRAKGGDVALGA